MSSGKKPIGSFFCLDKQHQRQGKALLPPVHLTHLPALGLGKSWEVYGLGSLVKSHIKHLKIQIMTNGSG